MIRKRFLAVILLLLILLSACSKSSTGDVTYVYNKRSHKFHRPDCVSVGDMAEHNKLFWYGSRYELMSTYPDADPCHNCYP